MKLTPELEADIRSKVNPAYKDQRGTESYERDALLSEIDRLRGGEVIGYAMVRDGRVQGLERTLEQTRSWKDAAAVPVVMVEANV